MTHFEDLSNGGRDLDGNYRGVIVASGLKMHTAVAARPVEANLAAIARVGF